VDAFVAIHDLRNSQVGNKRREGMDLVSIEVGSAFNAIDHIAQGDLCGRIETGVERHGDHMRRRFGHRPFKVHFGAKSKPERANLAAIGIVVPGGGVRRPGCAFASQVGKSLL